MPDLADIAAAGGLWTELGCTDLLIIRSTCSALRAAVKPTLIAALADLAVEFGPRKRLAALRVLAGVSAGGDARTAKLAASCLRDGGGDVRLAAARAFATAAPGIEPDEVARLAIACLCPAFVDSDYRVCVAAAKALPRLVPRGDPDAAAAASAGLRHSAPAARRAAVAAVGEVGPRGDAATIASVAATAEGDLDWGVRAAACRVLPRLAERGDEVAYRALTRCLNDPETMVRRVAMGAVVHISVRPSQHFVKWAPAPVAAPDPSAVGSISSKKRQTQQRLCLESPLSLSPPQDKRRRISVSSGVASVASKTKWATSVRCDKPMISSTRLSPARKCNRENSRPAW